MINKALPADEATSPVITVEDIIGSPVDTLPKVTVPPVVPSSPVTPVTPYVPQQQNTFQRRSFQPNQGNFNGFDERSIPDANLPTETVSGVLDLTEMGHGYLRPEGMPSNKDVYISSSQIRRFQLRPGDMVTGQARRPKENERYWGLLKVEKVNDIDVDKLGERAVFDKLTPIFPNERLTLETDPDIVSTRLIDLICPIGKGQRGLIVSPPKAGKTWLLKDISTAVAKNFPEIHLMAVLIGERPEEVTDLTHHIKDVTNGTGDMFSSNFDEPPEDQTHIAEIGLEREI